MKESKAFHLLWMVTILVTIAGVLMTGLASAGSLEPVAAPSSTMKTLDEVEPRIAIPASSTGADTYSISQSGSYYLAGDRVCSRNGILVNADNVTIDLMEYSLIGLGTGEYNGIDINARLNVEIRNGTIRNFDTGIQDLNTEINGHRIIDARILLNTKSGIDLKGSGNYVKGCTITDNGANITLAYGIYSGAKSIVVDNIVNNNGTNSGGIRAISAGFSSRVAGNLVTKNGYSASSSVLGIIVGDFSTVTGNTCNENGEGAGGDVYGMYVGGGSTVTGNTSGLNGQNGEGTAYGIYIAFSGNCLIDQNTAYLNDLNMTTCASCTMGINHTPAP